MTALLLAALLTACQARQVAEVRYNCPSCAGAVSAPESPDSWLSDLTRFETKTTYAACGRAVLYFRELPWQVTPDGTEPPKEK